MRSPSDMRIIQIDITNACIHTCSNCSRMCGHHKKPFFMDFDTFKKAVDSLEGYDGTIGIMGGEPTLHPEFVKFALYLVSKYPPKSGENVMLQPTDQFIRNLKYDEQCRTTKYMEAAGSNARVKGPGLWSSLASHYGKYYELIQDIFVYQCVNDHNHSCYHQPVMVCRKDLGVNDDEWETLRDNCWMQMNWSASITPKGAFFCEVAAALDMLFDGPGGWPIEAGWWKKTPEEFGAQTNWCEWCGLALKTRSRDANEGVDDVSETFLNRLKTMDSPKLKKGFVNIYHKDENEDESLIRHNIYHDNDYDRLADSNHSIFPDGFTGVVIDTYAIEDIVNTINSMQGQFKKILAIIKEEHLEQYSMLQYPNIDVFTMDKMLGENLNQILLSLDGRQYVVCAESGIIFRNDFCEILKRYVINPGVFHKSVAGGIDSRDLLELISTKDKQRRYMFLFHTAAKALQDDGLSRLRKCVGFTEIEKLWEDNKVIDFGDRVLHGEEISERTVIEPGLRYMIYGAGSYGEKALQLINKYKGEAVGFCDSAEEKWDTSYLGLSVISPDQLIEYRKTYDKVVIGALAYDDIYKKLVHLGIKCDEIIWPLYFLEEDEV